MQKYWQDILCGGNFKDTTSVSFIKAYRFYFRMGVIFTKQKKAQKTWKITPSEISTLTVVFQLEMCRCDTDAPTGIAKLEYGTC